MTTKCPTCGNENTREKHCVHYEPPAVEIERFKAIADGKRWEIDAARSVAVHPGARGEIMLTWINGENTVNVRLSKEAARLTALAIFTYSRNLPADMDGPPVA